MQENTSQNNEEIPMEDFESMLEESLNTPSKGAVVSGTVVQITEQDILVNIGSKTEGVIPREECVQDGELTVKQGDEIEVMVVGVSGGGGNIRLSKKVLNLAKDWNNIKESFDKGEPVNVKINKKVDKGFAGSTGEVSAFILDNHIDTKKGEPKADDFVGKELECKILKIDHKHKSILASRKVYLIEKRTKEKKELFESIKEGDKLRGKVKTIKNYGAFIDLGAVDGFVHKDNVSWGRVKHPGRFISEGDEVDVLVLKVDTENDKLEVGMKQTVDDPWLSVKEKYPMDSTVKGTVITRKRSGYILEIEPGVDGFIPNDELSWLKSTKTKLEPKDIVEGRVIAYDDENKKVHMSIKLLSENPWNTLAEKHPEGSIVKGVIKNITDFGIFVDFGGLVDGLIRKADVSWTGDVKDLNDLYKVGDKIEAKILKIDPEKERISLGVKQLEKNPWKEINSILPSGKVVEAKIINVTKDQIELDLHKGIKGVIVAKELDENPVNPMDKFKVGDTVKAVVLKADKRNRVVYLSIRKYLMDSEKREVNEYLKQLNNEEEGSFSLGSILKDKLK
jgi:ribosomal protein S1